MLKQNEVPQFAKRLTYASEEELEEKLARAEQERDTLMWIILAFMLLGILFGSGPEGSYFEPF